MELRVLPARRGRTSSIGVLLAVLCAGALFAQTDPLPSWNDTAPKKAILQFVADTTTAGSPGFVPEAERIATFDNDGTLWAEQPMYTQLAFVFARVQALAPKHPEWKTEEPYKSVLAGNFKGALACGEKCVQKMIAVTHAGMTADDFAKTVAEWIATAKNPVKGRLYTQMVYQPMLELLACMRANGFKTYIVSGGGIDFMRPWTEKTYGIPPEQVVGSTGQLKYELRNGTPVLIKLPEVDLIDDGPGKPVGINRNIGRRPVFAFGNSDGDQQMLEYTWGGAGKRFAGIVHHTDAEREWAYDHPSAIGQLDKALVEAKEKGWIVVDMKNDWKTVFPPAN